MILKPDLSIIFGNKASLKRSEETGILLEDEQVIALMEGDMQDTDVNGDLATIYASTKLQPDTAIAHPDHGSLKKRVVIIPVAARYAAAAVILLLVSIGSWITFSPGSSPVREVHTLASIETKAVKLESISSGNIQLYSFSSEYSMITAREDYTLNKIDRKYTDQLQVQYALSISNASSGVIPTSYQLPATSNLAYANADRKKRTLMGKVFNGMFNRIKAPFERTEAQAKPGPEQGFSIWHLAELGVKGVNTLGDHEYTVIRDYNKKGNVKRPF